jgi:hypothetical protein
MAYVLYQTPAILDQEGLSVCDGSHILGEQILSLQRVEYSSNFLISMTSTTATGLYQSEQDEIFFVSGIGLFASAIPIKTFVRSKREEAELHRL